MESNTCEPRDPHILAANTDKQESNMLAQNFMTAEALGMLEREEFKFIAADQNPQPLGFNMGQVERRGECGTVCCIAGWACQFTDGAFRGPIGPSEQSRSFAQLIMPSGVMWSRVSVPQAANALRNYLTLGQPRWDEVVTAS
jgi:hypothetical protein